MKERFYKPGEIATIPLFKTPNRPPDWSFEFTIGDGTKPRRFNFWFNKEK